MKWVRKLLGIKEPERTLVCVSQSQTWQWPSHLGEKTPGHCSECGEPIFYEKQNEHFVRKICNRCAGFY
jgi:RNA polymerase-binding transcription factor DksA